MKIVSYLRENHEQLGVLIKDTVYPMDVLHPELPGAMSMFLNYWEDYFPFAQAGEKMRGDGSRESSNGFPISELQLLAPVPFSTSCRAGYALWQHHASTRRNRTVDMLPEFEQSPIFYFTIHLSMKGPEHSRFVPY